MLKDITLTTLLLIGFIFFIEVITASEYYFEYVISLSIKLSLVPISNHPIDLALTLKEKNHTDNTLGKEFLLNSVPRLQKLK